MYFNIILLCVALRTSLYVSDFPTKILQAYVFFLSAMSVTNPSHLMLLDLVNCINIRSLFGK
jgi:hypothetical protein